MASINKSDMSKDRKTHGGKGDLTRNGFENFRNSDYWKRSKCCGAKVSYYGAATLRCLNCTFPCEVK